MKFLILRDGLLLVNPLLIASIETFSGQVLLTVSSGTQYRLTGNDAKTVLQAIDGETAQSKLAQIAPQIRHANKPRG